MWIKGFEWDRWNAVYIEERHRLSPEVVEEVFCSRPVVRRVRGGKLAAYGQADDGRYLTLSSLENLHVEPIITLGGAVNEIVH